MEDPSTSKTVRRSLRKKRENKPMSDTMGGEDKLSQRTVRRSLRKKKENEPMSDKMGKGEKLSKRTVRRCPRKKRVNEPMSETMGREEKLPERTVRRSLRKKKANEPMSDKMGKGEKLSKRTVRRCPRRKRANEQILYTMRREDKLSERTVRRSPGKKKANEPVSDTMGREETLSKTTLRRSLRKKRASEPMSDSMGREDKPSERNVRRSLRKKKANEPMSDTMGREEKLSKRTVRRNPLKKAANEPMLDAMGREEKLSKRIVRRSPRRKRANEQISETMGREDKLPERDNPVKKLSREKIDETASSSTKQTPFDEKRFIDQKLIGRGYFGRVYSVYDPVSNRRMAVKYLTKLRTRKSLYENEIEMMELLDGNNRFLQKYGEREQEENFVIYMELFSGLSLEAVLYRYSLSITAMQFIFHEIAASLGELRSLSIIHRDIKTRNILIDVKSGNVKIIDFGLAACGPRTQGIYGTDIYMAPEVFISRKDSESSYGFEVDVFSFGAVCLEVTTGSTPYTFMFYKCKSSERDKKKVEQEIIAGKIVVPSINDIPEEKQKIGSGNLRKILNFTNKLLEYKPENRPRPDEILADPIFTKSSIEEVRQTGLKAHLTEK